MDITDYCINYSNYLEPIQRSFDKNAVAICLCSSDAYAPYCGIAIQSIIDNSSADINYEIFIMEMDMTDRNKLLIISLIKNKANFSIRFINMKSAMSQIRINTWAHFSPVACFKLFLMSDVFKYYTKFLVTDTDLVFMKDAAELFSKDISNYLMAATNDVIMRHHVAYKKYSAGFAPSMPVSQYLEEYLGFGTDEWYYNTGVVLLNIKKCREENFFQRSIYLLKHKGYTYQEQDVLNELTVGRVLNLELNWNVLGTENSQVIVEALSKDTRNAYEEALRNPYIVHFAGGQKPWTHIGVPYGECFFNYAKHTPWYEIILQSVTFNYTNHVRSALWEQMRKELTFRSKVKRRLDVLIPIGSKPRTLLCKFFPRGKGVREWISRHYNGFINRNIDSIRIDKENRQLCSINKVYSRNLEKRISEHEVLFDSKNGTDLAGNILRLMIELSTGNYGKLSLYLAFEEKSKERIEKILDRYGLKNIRLVKWRSKAYFRHLARAKYLVTDLYIANEYIKREGQILISTAHGTPIKAMGRDCHSETQGHLQRTHTLADYQVFPSAYMKEKLFSAFMEDNLFTGKALKSGYCRNDIFFDKERREIVREELNYCGKTVYAYLPTFRGIGGCFESERQNAKIIEMCSFLDARLPEDYILLIKLHNFNVCNIDFSKFAHIRQFPMDYEVYDVLNATDGLISDYSSVFFDYANSQHKIILFQYDLEDYMAERGIYLKWDELPFPIVKEPDELLREMLSRKNYDDTAFMRRFCTYDNPHSSELVCREIWKNEKCCEEFLSPKNGKKNVLLHVGNMDLRNPTTYLVQEFLSKGDTSKYNYILYYYEYDLFDCAYRLENLPKEITYLSYLGLPAFTKRERKHFYKKEYGKIQRAFLRECRRSFADLPIDAFVDLSGKESAVAESAKFLNCKKVIVKWDEDTGITQECYAQYDNVLPAKSAGATGLRENEKTLILGYTSEILERNMKLIEEVIAL